MRNPVRMYHPDLDHTQEHPIEVADRAFSIWQSRGWLMVEDDDSLYGYPETLPDWSPPDGDEPDDEEQ